MAKKDQTAAARAALSRQRAREQAPRRITGVSIAIVLVVVTLVAVVVGGQAEPMPEPEPPEPDPDEPDPPEPPEPEPFVDPDPPPDGVCQTDDECPFAHTCVLGECQPQCWLDAIPDQVSEEVLGTITDLLLVLPEDEEAAQPGWMLAAGYPWAPDVRAFWQVAAWRRAMELLGAWSPGSGVNAYPQLVCPDENSCCYISEPSQVALWNEAGAIFDAASMGENA